jgi:hypothetical protein
MKPDLRALAAAATALDTAWVDAVRNAKVPDESLCLAGWVHLLCDSS